MCSSMKPAEAGRLVLVVGPSGAGKDTLIGAARKVLADEARFHFPIRFVTRPSDPTEQTHLVAPEDFHSMRREGAFALHWEAHGHCYGIGRDIEDVLRTGVHVIANVSRTVVEGTRASYPGTLVLLINAAPDVRRRRIAGRARETAGEMSARNIRTVSSFGEADADIVIDNSAALDEAVEAFVSALRALHSC